MKEYIKFFKYDADYQLAKPNLPEPHAVYCWETNIIDISKPVWNEKQYLAFKAVDGPATLTITNVGGAAPQLWYSYDQTAWSDWTSYEYREINIQEGEKVYLKGLNDRMGYSSAKYSYFSGTGLYEVSGSLSSLLDGDNIYGNLDKGSYSYLFYKLFYKSNTLKSLNVDLPYYKIGPYTCYSICQQSLSIVSASIKLSDKLQEITDYMFNDAFQGCTSISEFDLKLPESLTTIGSNAFSYCCCDFESLESYELIIPDSVTTIKSSAFSAMFQTAPGFTSFKLVIPRNASLGYSAFSFLLYGLTKLRNLTIEHYPPYSSSTTYNHWVDNVPNESSNIFRIYKDDEINWPRNSDAIPSNFTIEYLV